jgi:signal transduction histidine kinase
MTSVTPARKPRRVKAAFIGPIALALTLVMCVFAVAIYLVEASVRDRDLAERSVAAAKLFEQKLGKDANLMRAVLRAMTTNRALEKAFRDRDRASLARQTGPLFETLRNEHRITHLYFTGADLINLYRVHSPDEFGDEIDRMTMLKARDQAAAASGLELGPLGTLTLRMVVPWQHNEKVFGYLEIGEEVEHLIDEIRDSLTVDLAVLVDKKFLRPEQWQRGLVMMQRQGDWQRFATHVALAQTSEQLPATFDKRMLDGLLAGRNAVIEDGGRSLHLALVPLKDAGGRHIGELVVIRDIGGLQATFRRSIMTVTLVSLLVAAGVLAIFYVALGRVERDYQRQHDLEIQILRLNTEHHRILQLEKLSALGTMVGGIAHQLNNPLVGVVNMAQLAERETDNPQQTRELLGEIRRAGEDCRVFVRRMLEFSKVSCFDSKPTPMASLIEDTVLLFRQAEDRHHPVDVRLPDEPVVLMVDPILIRHALFNLLLNAAQAASGDDPIVITLEAAVEPDGNATGWSLAVTDRGTGIPPDVLEKIFVPFFTTRNDGTGLGLPVVQHVALLHGGHVSATSEPGNGTRLALWLPMSQPQSA